jgi:hypothetical protein
MEVVNEARKRRQAGVASGGFKFVEEPFGHAQELLHGVHPGPRETDLLPAVIARVDRPPEQPLVLEVSEEPGGTRAPGPQNRAQVFDTGRMVDVDDAEAIQLVRGKADTRGEGLRNLVTAKEERQKDAT